MKSDSIENVYIDKVQPFILLRYEPIWSIEKLVNSRQKMKYFINK